MGKRTSLPSPNDPLMLSDGSVMLPSTAQTFGVVEVPNSSEAKRLVSNTRRKLVDLPALPQQMNAYSVLLVYTASGLSDNEAAVAMGLSAQQVSRMRESPIYQQLESFVVEAAKEAAAAEVVGILAQGERKAAKHIVDLVDCEDPKISLAAAKDVLDRRGHNAKQQIDIRQEMLNTFRIELVDKRNEPSVVIDVEADDAEREE